MTSGKIEWKHRPTNLRKINGAKNTLEGGFRTIRAELFSANVALDRGAVSKTTLTLNARTRNNQSPNGTALLVRDIDRLGPPRCGSCLSRHVTQGCGDVRFAHITLPWALIFPFLWNLVVVRIQRGHAGKTLICEVRSPNGTEVTKPRARRGERSEPRRCPG